LIDQHPRDKVVRMASYGKVVGGQFIDATIDTNRKGELELAVRLTGFAAFKRQPKPTLSADAVASWQEIVPETRGGAAGAVSKVGQAVARAGLPGSVGRAASTAIGSAADLVGARHTVRVDWVDGKQSLIELPDKLFQHFAILLKDCQIPTAVPEPEPPPPPGAVETLAKEASQLIRSTTESRRQLAETAPATQPDVTEQIAKLAALREQGALTEDEFAAKKAELLSRI
jgi:hypothetical protein